MGHIGKTVSQNIVSTSEITDGTITNDDLASDIAITTTGDTSLNGNVTINDSGGDKNFRVESDGDANALVVDGGLNRVQISNHDTGAFDANGDNLIVGSGSGHNGMTIFSGSGHAGLIEFAQGNSGADAYNGYIQYEHNNDQFTIGVNSAGTGKSLNITTSGNVKFPSGQGIDFSSNTHTSSGTMSSELFHSYEEGSFSPSSYADSGNFAWNSSYNTLYYTKVGRVVHIYGYLYTTSTNSPSGTINLGNLPFTATNAVTNYVPVDVRVWGISADPTTGRSNSSQVYARINPNTTLIAIYDTTDTTLSATGGNWLNLDGSTDFLISGTYMTDA